MGKIKKFFCKSDGEKVSLNGGKIALFVVPLAIVIGLVGLRVRRYYDTSFVEGGGRQNAPVNPRKAAPLAPSLMGLGEAEKTAPMARKERIRRPPVVVKESIRYGARQVISRDGEGGGFLPIGTKIKASLATAIDTRFVGQLIQVVLTEGAHYRGERRLDKGTALFGSFRYSGVGDRVFLGLTRGITPRGREFTLSAQVLNPGDLSPGLAGIFHGNADGRVASTLALAAGTGAAQALTRKEHLGGGGAPTIKSTLKNALIHGAARAGTMELEREMKRVAGAPEYVTVAAGSGLIVILTETLKGVP